MITLKKNDWEALLYLRGILAFYVLYHHIRNVHIPRVSTLEEDTPLYESVINVFINITGHFGLQAVLCFFVISGMSIYAGYKPDRKIGAFYFRRFKRLYPALLFSILTTFILSLCYTTSYNLKDFIATLSFCNGILFGGSFAGNSPYWSLSCEAWYYLVFPIILFFIKSRWGQLSLILFSLLVPLCFEQRVIVYLSSWILGVFLIKWGGRFLFSKKISICILLASLALATGPSIILDYKDIGSALELKYVTLLSGVPCGVATLSLLHLLRDRTLSNKLFRFLGNISYSLYLIHYPVLLAVESVIKDGSFLSSYALAPLLSTLISVFLAFIAYKYIEQCFANRRTQEYRPPDSN